MEKRILHLDMDAFFASVEQQANPSLKGKPIAVIGSDQRTVITTASYEARKSGVKTGMTKYEGKKLCKDIIFIVGSYRKYSEASEKIMNILKCYTPVIEAASIDEAYMDITESLTLFKGENNIALSIKQKIKETLGLTCSIGIAPNKLLAKLAGGLKKPDGLAIIKKENVKDFLRNIPVGELCGIGKKTAKELEMIGIRTCGEMATYPAGLLEKRFGKTGEYLRKMALGIDETPVIPEGESEGPKSVGHSFTLPKDITDTNAMKKHIMELSKMVGKRIRRYGCRGRTVVLIIRYKDFTTFSKRLTTENYIDYDTDIYKACLKIFNSIILEQPVRLLGVTLANLEKGGHQLYLFAEDKKKELLGKSMDEINERYGNNTITYGALLEK